MSPERSPLAGRRVVVGVTGSIAAYKAVLLVRRLIERGATVDVALTRSATAFITPLTFASLTHRPVVGDVMDLDADQQIAHIELAEAADAVVIAPATANVLAELAIGMASSPVTAIACASRHRRSFRAAIHRSSRPDRRVSQRSANRNRRSRGSPASRHILPLAL